MFVTPPKSAVTEHPHVGMTARGLTYCDAPRRSAITLRRDRQDSTDHSDTADSNDPTLNTEPIENTDTAEPTDPIDSTDPTEPTESTEPFEAMHKIEFSDPTDHRELRPDAMSSILPQPPQRWRRMAREAAGRHCDEGSDRRLRSAGPAALGGDL
jgi:hypothetical protein